MKKDGLTAKQARFVEEYLIDLNATRAAARVGYAHPTTQGPRLLENVGVKLAIEKAQETRSKRTGIDAEWVLRRLQEEADADIADLYDAETGALKPVKEWPKIWRQGLVAGLEVVDEGHDDMRATVRKIKLSDRIKRLELIGKHVNVQAFREQVEHKGGISLTVSQEDAEL